MTKIREKRERENEKVRQIGRDKKREMLRKRGERIERREREMDKARVRERQREREKETRERDTISGLLMYL